MKYFLFLLFIFSTNISFAQKEFVIDPNAEVRTLSGSFSSIKVSSGINLYLSHGDDEAIAVSASDEKLKEGIKTEVENGELHIFYSGERFHYNGGDKISVYVAYKNLGQLVGSGASDIYIAGVMELPVLNVQLSGASDMKGAVNIGEMNIKLSGASDLKLTGNAKTVNIDSNGASDVKGYGFTAEVCNVKVSGASDVDISISKELSANASGASDVHFKGPAEIKFQESHGASNIARVE